MRSFLSVSLDLTTLFPIAYGRCCRFCNPRHTQTYWLFSPSLHPHYRDFLTTMASADFSQFVITTANDSACETSTLKVHALSSHLSATFTRTSSNFWTSSSFADLSVFPSLICDLCPSNQEFAYSFLRIPPHDGHPCCSAIRFLVAQACSGRVKRWRGSFRFHRLPPQTVHEVLPHTAFR